MQQYCESDDFAHHESEVLEFLRIIGRLRLPVAEGARILDLGAGQGMHAGFLCEHFAHVHCADVIDYSALYGGEFLKLLDEKHKRHQRVFDLSKISFQQTDAQDLIYRDGFFDFVFTVNTFEHIPNPGRALYEIIRVLKPGGHAYISFDPIWTADTGSHFAHLVAEPWAHLVMNEEGFIKQMRSAGADEGQVREFRVAMNRRSLAYFVDLFDGLEPTMAAVAFRDSWKGLVKPESADHEHFKLALKLGYAAEELMMRGLRFVIRKMDTN